MKTREELERAHDLLSAAIDDEVERMRRGAAPDDGYLLILKGTMSSLCWALGHEDAGGPCTTLLAIFAAQFILGPRLEPDVSMPRLKGVH